MRVTVVGGSAENVVEVCVGVGNESRKIVSAFDPDVNRLVVGDEFGEQGDYEQSQKNPERPITATVGLEIPPTANVDGRKLKSLRERGEAHGAGRLGVRRRRTRRYTALDRLESFFGGCPYVHLTPLASR